jgi:hypothetical protein
MATRSLIGKLNSDNTVSYIYCHFDGYPEHNGVILQEHYDTPFKVDQLLALGDLSILAEEIGEKQDFDNIKSHKDNWCLAYGRDRGHSGIEMKTVSRDKFFGDAGYIDYLYLYNNEFEWECYSAWDLSSVTIPTAAIV